MHFHLALVWNTYVLTLMVNHRKHVHINMKHQIAEYRCVLTIWFNKISLPLRQRPPSPYTSRSWDLGNIDELVFISVENIYIQYLSQYAPWQSWCCYQKIYINIFTSNECNYLQKYSLKNINFIWYLYDLPFIHHISNSAQTERMAHRCNARRNLWKNKI